MDMGNKSRIYLSAPHMGGDELDYVREAFQTNWISTVGPHVGGFEQDLCKYTGAAHAAALSSGTAAIHLALILSGVEAGDEVLCSSFTFIASASPIIYQRATPVFVDSEEDSWNMDPEMLEEAIIDRVRHGQKPRALVLVHLYGQAANMGRIKAICDEYEIALIEDAAESLGSLYKGRHTGTVGDFGVYSFNGNKIITTSGGGMLVSHDGEQIAKARFLATQARDQAPHYEHSEVGFNYRLSNVLAGIGRGQLRVLEDHIQKRHENYYFYQKRLGGLPGISFIPDSVFGRSNCWLTCIIVEPDDFGATREDIRLALEAENIESRPLWKPLNMQPLFDEARFYGTGVSEGLFEKGLCLPSGSNLSAEELARVTNVISSVQGGQS